MPDNFKNPDQFLMADQAPVSPEAIAMAILRAQGIELNGGAGRPPQPTSSQSSARGDLKETYGNRDLFSGIAETSFSGLFGGLLDRGTFPNTRKPNNTHPQSLLTEMLYNIGRKQDFLKQNQSRDVSATNPELYRLLQMLYSSNAKRSKKK